MTATDSRSAFRHRVPVAVLALVGAGIATYLTLFQLGVLDTVFEPFFGDGSRRVLTSPVSRALPVPDAALGAVAYLAELVLELSGGRDRWRRRPWLVLLLGLVAAGFALDGVALLILQPTLTGTFCTLCVCSALISFAVAFLVRREVLAALHVVRERRRAGLPLARALTSG
ncbi:vitamin K epoxide reductase family protein [Pseudonocardia nigra]|uniref:vitamin K epoxide reductase family protein n=1 Tax=Pseudonocardia nigra TaxID=1921578 RepID=UPI001C5D736E|nr:vitamin K epoxide reductase family protein [Pseudonocardia nigra]